MPRETLSMSNILCNVLYSVMLMITGLIAAIGIGTYQWIETDESQIQKFATIPTHVPGFRRVSCGLVSYCIDAADRVSECEFPWPIYNDDLTSQPTRMWTAVVVIASLGIVLVSIAWLYTLVACFGCFRTKWQQHSVKMVDVSAGLLFISLIVWGASFPHYAATDCISRNAEGECTDYELVFPSHIIMGGKNATGCRICGPNMSYFQLSSTCSLGWGAIFVVVAVILAVITACVGRKVKSRWHNKVSPVMA